MVIETPKRKILFIGEEEHSIKENSAWIDTNSLTLKVHENETLVIKADFSDLIPHGISVTVTHGNKSMKFVDGILVSYT